MGLRPNKPFETIERKTSNSQSIVSIKNDRKHHRIIKQVHQPRQLKSTIQKTNPLILDPRKCSASFFQQHCETLDEFSPLRNACDNTQISMTFSSTEESTIKDTVDSPSQQRIQVFNFNPFSQDVLGGKTPISEFQNMEMDLPFLDLDN